MKYAIIIADGGADLPIAELKDQTPFEAAKAPNLSWLARAGRVGCAATTPQGMITSSDVCSMSLFGYDPLKYHTGRAPIEAAALGIPMSESDWIFRLNFVTIGKDDSSSNVMIDHSAGAIPAEQARRIVPDLLAYWKHKLGSSAQGLRLVPGVAYRNILIDSGEINGCCTREYSKLSTTPPHEMPRWPIEPHRPTTKLRDLKAQEGARFVNTLMDLAGEMLPDHPVNRERLARGERPANFAWIWGHGTRPALQSFHSRFGLRGAMTTAVDLLAGLAALVGWDKLDVPGLSSFHDNDYKAQGDATCRALDDYDIVCCHVESPDEASHQGDWKTKLATIEAIDKHIVGPVLHKLQTFGDPQRDPKAEGWRILFMPDHYTLVSTRKHDPTPSPFLIAGSWIRSAVERQYNEREALSSDLCIDPGHDLMEYFLRSGLRPGKM